MEERKKRILILTADAGFGHRSAAIAIQEALNICYPDQLEVEIVNPLDDKRAPVLLRDSQSDYDKWVRKAPELYKLGYEVSDQVLPSAILESGLAVILFELMRDILRKTRPDVVVCTYPMYQHALVGVTTAFKANIPIITVVTDLATVHRLWFNDRVTSLLVPTQIVYDLAVESGVAPEKLHITGIPVHPGVIKAEGSKKEIRERLGWDPDLFTILAVGSKRVEGLPEALNVINHFGHPLQLAVVAGKDEEMVTELKGVEWHIPAFVYEFVTNMPELMHAADLIVCKAGGLIVTESLACGLPMMLINVIPGQETGNMEYVVRNGAGILANDPMSVLESLAHFTSIGMKSLEEAAAAAKKLGCPQAAYEAADIIWQTAQIEPDVPDLSFRSNLINLLALNQIPWIDGEPLNDDNNTDNN